MTTTQEIELQAIIQHFSTLKEEEIKTAFDLRWKPFVQSLETEADRVQAFQVFYEWQIAQMNVLADHISQLPLPSASPQKKAVA